MRNREVMVPIRIAVPHEIREKVEMAATKRQVSMGSIVRDLLRAGMKAEGLA